MPEVTEKAKSNFTNVLGKNSNLRIMEFFIEGRELSYSKKDIRDCIGASYPMMSKIIPELLEMGIIKVTKTIGKNWCKFYTLNMDNPIAKKLTELFDTINKCETERYFKNENK